MKKFLILILLLSSCTKSRNNSNKDFSDSIDTNTEVVNSTTYHFNTINNVKKNAIQYDKAIETYLYQKTVTPQMIINNTDDVLKYNFEKTYQIFEHKLIWKTNENGLKIIINNQDVKETVLTKNDVSREGKDNIGFANNLNQVKYYKLDNGDEIIGLLLNYRPCTGIGCSIQYILLYDLNNRKTTNFGDFRRKYGFELYNLSDKGKLCYLSQTYLENHASEIDTFKYELYEHQQSGYFELAKQNNEPYFFKHIHSYYRDDERQEFEENWFEKIIR